VLTDPLGICVEQPSILKMLSLAIVATFHEDIRSSGGLHVKLFMTHLRSRDLTLARNVLISPKKRARNDHLRLNPLDYAV
jgi:hypothetical protein